MISKHDPKRSGKEDAVLFAVRCGGDFFFSEYAYTCAMCVETENGCFPSEDWTDFPETVFCWWIGELKSMFAGSDRYTYVFRFMDGPYSVRCKKAGDHVKMSFFQNSLSTLPDCETTLQEMKEGFQSALETLRRCLYLEGREEYISIVLDLIAEIRSLDSYLASASS